MNTKLFPRIYTNDTEYSMVLLTHDWDISFSSYDNSRIDLSLINRTADEAEKIAKTFGAPLDIPFWKFWVKPPSVKIIKTYQHTTTKE